MTLQSRRLLATTMAMSLASTLVFAGTVAALAQNIPSTVVNNTNTSSSSSISSGVPGYIDFLPNRWVTEKGITFTPKSISHGATYYIVNLDVSKTTEPVQKAFTRWIGALQKFMNDNDRIVIVAQNSKAYYLLPHGKTTVEWMGKNNDLLNTIIHADTTAQAEGSNNLNKLQRIFTSTPRGFQTPFMSNMFLDTDGTEDTGDLAMRAGYGIDLNKPAQAGARIVAIDFTDSRGASVYENNFGKWNEWLNRSVHPVQRLSFVWNHDPYSNPEHRKSMLNNIAFDPSSEPTTITTLIRPVNNTNGATAQTDNTAEISVGGEGSVDVTVVKEQSDWKTVRSNVTLPFKGIVELNGKGVYRVYITEHGNNAGKRTSVFSEVIFNGERFIATHQGLEYVQYQYCSDARGNPTRPATVNVNSANMTMTCGDNNRPTVVSQSQIKTGIAPSKITTEFLKQSIPMSPNTMRLPRNIETWVQQLQKVDNANTSYRTVPIPLIPNSIHVTYSHHGASVGEETLSGNGNGDGYIDMSRFTLPKGYVLAEKGQQKYDVDNLGNVVVPVLHSIPATIIASDTVKKYQDITVQYVYHDTVVGEQRLLHQLVGDIIHSSQFHLPQGYVLPDKHGDYRVENNVTQVKIVVNALENSVNNTNVNNNINGANSNSNTKTNDNNDNGNNNNNDNTNAKGNDNSQNVGVPPHDDTNKNDRVVDTIKGNGNTSTVIDSAQPSILSPILLEPQGNSHAPQNGIATSHESHNNTGGNANNPEHTDKAGNLGADNTRNSKDNKRVAGGNNSANGVGGNVVLNNIESDNGTSSSVNAHNRDDDANTSQLGTNLLNSQKDGSEVQNGQSSNSSDNITHNTVKQPDSSQADNSHVNKNAVVENRSSQDEHDQSHDEDSSVVKHADAKENSTQSTDSMKDSSASLKKNNLAVTGVMRTSTFIVGGVTMMLALFAMIVAHYRRVRE